MYESNLLILIYFVYDSTTTHSLKTKQEENESKLRCFSFESSSTAYVSCFSLLIIWRIHPLYQEDELPSDIGMVFRIVPLGNRHLCQVVRICMIKES